MASLEEDDQAYANLYKDLWAELDKIEHKINQFAADARNAGFQEQIMLPGQVLRFVFDSETEIVYLRQVIDELADDQELPAMQANRLLYHLGRLYGFHTKLKELVQHNQQESLFGNLPDDIDYDEGH